MNAMKTGGAEMRADGRRAKGLTAIEQAIPHIMPKRVDAQNYVTEYVDEEVTSNCSSSEFYNIKCS